MLTLYDRRLILFYLSNAASRLKRRAKEAQSIEQWILEHENSLGCQARADELAAYPGGPVEGVRGGEARTA